MHAPEPLRPKQPDPPPLPNDPMTNHGILRKPYMLVGLTPLPEFVANQGWTPLTEDEIKGIGKNLEVALEFLHEEGFIHGEVKESNVLIREFSDGGIKAYIYTPFLHKNRAVGMTAKDDMELQEALLDRLKSHAIVCSNLGTQQAKQNEDVEKLFFMGQDSGKSRKASSDRAKTASPR
ncbi:uncharacterized protein [Ptychodera flava]|uniref:uncharacterized protein n=1 Tax=Ptychodera flava TaxID=63121 RepID=UPI003969D0EA